MSRTRTTETEGAVLVVPARHDSQRFPGKVLAEVGGRPLIQWVYENAARATRIRSAWVATDSPRVAEACLAFTPNVVVSKASHASGTDRVAELARELEANIFINVQTDEPLMDPVLVDALVAMLEDGRIRFASAAAPIRNMREFLDPNVVKVVRDARGDALYFSRASIPWSRESPPGPGTAWPKGLRAFKHIGIYGYRRQALLELAALPRSPLEVTESLEQLRALERGWRMRILEWDYHGVGVDTPEDLERFRQYLRHDI